MTNHPVPSETHRTQRNPPCNHYRAKHILYRAKHILYRAKHILYRAKHILYRAKHILYRAKHTPYTTEHTLYRNKHILYSLPSETHHVPSGTHSVPSETHSVPSETLSVPSEAHLVHSETDNVLTTERNTHCSERNTSCAERNTHYTERNTFCTKQNTFCTERNTFCTKRNISCTEQNTPCTHYRAEHILYRAEHILYRAEHILYGAEHILYRAEHILYGAEHILYRAEHILYRAEHILYRAEHILYGAEHILYRAEHILYGAEHILYRAEHILYGAEHILYRAEHILYGAEHILYRAEHILYGAEHILYGAEHILYRAEHILYRAKHTLQSLPCGTHPVPSRTHPVPSGTHPVRSGTHPVRSGTHLVPSKAHPAITTVRNTSCTEQNTSCTERNTSCTERNTSCIERNTSCTERNTSCTERNTSCTERNTSCTERNTSCTERNTSCTERNTSCTERNTSCTERNTSCTERNTSCTERNTSCTEQSTPCNHYRAKHTTVGSCVVHATYRLLISVLSLTQFLCDKITLGELIRITHVFSTVDSCLSSNCYHKNDNTQPIPHTWLGQRFQSYRMNSKMALCCSRAGLWHLRGSANRTMHRRTKATMVTAFSNDIPVDTSDSNALPFDEIPSPSTLPLIGNLHHYFPGGSLYGKSSPDSIKLLYERHGSLVKIKFTSGITLVHLYDANDIQNLLHQEGRYPIRHASFMLEHYNRKYNNDVQGLFTCHKQRWYRLRTNLQQKMLRPKTVSSYLPEQSAVADDLVARITSLRDENGEVQDLRQDLYRYATDSIGAVIFNKRLGALKDFSKGSEAEQFFTAVETLMQIVGKEYTSIPFYRLFRSPKYRLLEKNMKIIRTMAEKYTDQAVAAAQARVDKGEVMDGERGDLIPYLMTKTELTREDVLAVISDFIFAGVDTTTHAMAFALYLLSLNQKKQQKLSDEIDRVITDGQDVTEAAISRMPYLKAVLKESLRCMPVLEGTVRTLNKDMVFSGYRVPAGTHVCAVNGVVGKLEKYYKNADKFEPERWLRGTQTTALNPFASTPFGVGTRSCIGKRFAEQELHLGLIKILRKYRLEFCLDELKLEYATTNKPITPLNFRFIERR
ncbi:hypothetical protein ScPMuIL_016647 [Solemya velum]